MRINSFEITINVKLLYILSWITESCFKITLACSNWRTFYYHMQFIQSAAFSDAALTNMAFDDFFTVFEPWCFTLFDVWFISDFLLTPYSGISLHMYVLTHTFTQVLTVNKLKYIKINIYTVHCKKKILLKKIKCSFCQQFFI